MAVPDFHATLEARESLCDTGSAPAQDLDAARLTLALTRPRDIAPIRSGVF